MALVTSDQNSSWLTRSSLPSADAGHLAGPFQYLTGTLEVSFQYLPFRYINGVTYDISVSFKIPEQNIIEQYGSMVPSYMNSDHEPMRLSFRPYLLQINIELIFHIAPERYRPGVVSFISSQVYLRWRHRRYLLRSNLLQVVCTH